MGSMTDRCRAICVLAAVLWSAAGCTPDDDEQPAPDAGVTAAQLSYVGPTKGRFVGVRFGAGDPTVLDADALDADWRSAEEEVTLNYTEVRWDDALVGEALGDDYDVLFDPDGEALYLARKPGGDGEPRRFGVRFTDADGVERALLSVTAEDAAPPPIASMALARNGGADGLRVLDDGAEWTCARAVDVLGGRIHRAAPAEAYPAPAWGVDARAGAPAAEGFAALGEAPTVVAEAADGALRAVVGDGLAWCAAAAPIGFEVVGEPGTPGWLAPTGDDPLIGPVAVDLPVTDGFGRCCTTKTITVQVYNNPPVARDARAVVGEAVPWSAVDPDGDPLALVAAAGGDGWPAGCAIEVAGDAIRLPGGCPDLPPAGAAVHFAVSDGSSWAAGVTTVQPTAAVGVRPAVVRYDVDGPAPRVGLMQTEAGPTLAPLEEGVTGWEGAVFTAVRGQGGDRVRVEVDPQAPETLRVSVDPQDAWAAPAAPAFEVDYRTADGAEGSTWLIVRARRGEETLPYRVGGRARLVDDATLPSGAVLTVQAQVEPDPEGPTVRVDGLDLVVGPGRGCPSGRKSVPKVLAILTDGRAVAECADACRPTLDDGPPTLDALAVRRHRAQLAQGTLIDVREGARADARVVGIAGAEPLDEPAGVAASWGERAPAVAAAWRLTDDTTTALTADGALFVVDRSGAEAVAFDAQIAVGPDACPVEAARAVRIAIDDEGPGTCDATPRRPVAQSLSRTIHWRDTRGLEQVELRAVVEHPDALPLTAALIAESDCGPSTVEVADGELIARLRPADDISRRDRCAVFAAVAAACDPDGPSTPVELSLALTNTPPRRGTKFFTVHWTTHQTGSLLPVLDDEADPDGDPLTVAWVEARHGSAAARADGGPAQVHYRPPPGFVGEDVLRLGVGDGRDATEGVVTVTVINTPPVAVDDAATVHWSRTVRVAPTDVARELDEQDRLAWADPPVVGDPPARVALEPDGALALTAHPDAPDAFEVELRVTDGLAVVTSFVIVRLSNTPPIAQDAAVTVAPGEEVTLTLAGCGPQADGDLVRAELDGGDCEPQAVTLIDRCTARIRGGGGRCRAAFVLTDGRSTSRGALTITPQDVGPRSPVCAGDWAAAVEPALAARAALYLPADEDDRYCGETKHFRVLPDDPPGPCPDGEGTCVSATLDGALAVMPDGAPATVPDAAGQGMWLTTEDGARRLHVRVPGPGSRLPFAQSRTLTVQALGEPGAPPLPIGLHAVIDKPAVDRIRPQQSPLLAEPGRPVAWCPATTVRAEVAVEITVQSAQGCAAESLGACLAVVPGEQACTLSAELSDGIESTTATWKVVAMGIGDGLPPAGRVDLCRLPSGRLVAADALRAVPLPAEDIAPPPAPAGCAAFGSGGPRLHPMAVDCPGDALPDWGALAPFIAETRAVPCATTRLRFVPPDADGRCDPVAGRDAPGAFTVELAAPIDPLDARVVWAAEPAVVDAQGRVAFPLPGLPGAAGLAWFGADGRDGAALRVALVGPCADGADCGADAAWRALLADPDGAVAAGRPALLALDPVGDDGEGPAFCLPR